MSKDAIDKIADNANMIVNGYAFTKEDNGWISILNLNHPDCAMVIDTNGDLKDNQITVIQKFIKENYLDMYQKWKDFGGGDFYQG